MEYCKKCGAKIDANTGCCINCGLHVKDYSAKKKTPVIIKIAIVLIVAILVFLGVKSVINLVASKVDVAPNDGYLEVVDELMDAVYVDTNIEKFVSLMPETVVQQMIEKNFDGDEAAFQARMQEVYAEMEGMTADEGSVTWEINEEIDIVGVQLKQYEAVFEEEMGVAVKLRSAKALDLAVSYTQGGEAKKEGMYVIIGLIDDVWYLINFSQ